jgi:hypothetical protein
MTVQGGYDVIGDIHGYAERLEELLQLMDYVKRDGTWMHAELKAVFVGDYVDRGPENLRTCRIVMAMVEAGAAYAVMGNHDFNAVCLATPDPDQPGAFLRPHTGKNLYQAKATRAEMEKNPAEAAVVIAWLRALPLWFEAKDIHVVHAGWSAQRMSELAPFLDERGALTQAGLSRAARKGDSIHSAREYILNGPEAKLPLGISYRDPDGHVRSDGRLAWWRAGTDGLTWREAFVGDEVARIQIPEIPLPPGLLDRWELTKPVLFGHYWMQAPLAVLTPLHACVDASVAKGGRLAAYRSSGAAQLDPEGFLYA